MTESEATHTRSSVPLIVLIGLPLAVVALSGHGVAATELVGLPVQFASHATCATRSADVLVSFAKGGARGDLPGLLARHPGLASVLARGLVPFARGEAKRNSSAALTRNRHIVASYRVVGAAVSRDGVYLYAHEDLTTFAVEGGRLMDALSDFEISASVRIRLSKSLRPLAVDLPEGECADYTASVAGLMPRWAATRLERVGWDGRGLRDAAGAWAARSGRLPELVRLPRPAHADPHQHSQDVYALGVIPAAVIRLTIREVPTPRSTDPADPYALGRYPSSPDGRFECFSDPDGEALVIHDVEAGEWLRLRGPNLNSVQWEGIAWADDTLVFDVTDVGFAEPRPDEMTLAHIEVDFARRAVVRVVPIGPYTANWRR